MLPLCSHRFRHNTEQSHWNIIIFFHSTAFFGNIFSPEAVTLSVFKEHRMQTREKELLKAKFKIYKYFPWIIMQ